MGKKLRKTHHYIKEIVVLYFQRKASLLARGLAYSILTGSVPFVFLTMYAIQYLFLYFPELQIGFKLQIDSLLPRPIAALIMQLVTRLVDMENWSTLGILGLVGLLLVTRSVFSSLETSLSMVMKSPQERQLWIKQLIYLFLTVFAMVLFFSASYIRFAAGVIFEYSGLPTSLLGLATKALSVMLLWFGFIVIYRMCYHGSIHVPALLLVSLLVAISWLLINYLGVSVISMSGRNEIVYGFLAVVIVFLAWSYLFSVLLFIGGIIIARHSQLSASKKNGALYVFR